MKIAVFILAPLLLLVSCYTMPEPVAITDLSITGRYTGRDESPGEEVFGELQLFPDGYYHEVYRSDEEREGYNDYGTYFYDSLTGIIDFYCSSGSESNNFFGIISDGEAEFTAQGIVYRRKGGDFSSRGNIDNSDIAGVYYLEYTDERELVTVTLTLSPDGTFEDETRWPNTADIFKDKGTYTLHPESGIIDMNYYRSNEYDYTGFIEAESGKYYGFEGIFNRQ